MTDATEKARLSCRDIMTADVTTASPSTSISKAAALMRDGDMGSIPVVEAGKLVGIVTDRDIVVRALADGRGPEAAVAEAMTREVFSVRPDDFAFQAIRLMGEKQVRRIPVVEADGTLAGIISLADIALETEDERDIAEALEDISTGSSFWSKK